MTRVSIMTAKRSIINNSKAMEPQEGPYPSIGSALADEKQTRDKSHKYSDAKVKPNLSHSELSTLKT